MERKNVKINRMKSSMYNESRFADGIYYYYNMTCYGLLYAGPVGAHLYLQCDQSDYCKS